MGSLSILLIIGIVFIQPRLEKCNTRPYKIVKENNCSEKINYSLYTTNHPSWIFGIILYKMYWFDLNQCEIKNQYRLLESWKFLKFHFNISHFELALPTWTKYSKCLFKWKCCATRRSRVPVITRVRKNALKTHV